MKAVLDQNPLYCSGVGDLGVALLSMFNLILSCFFSTDSRASARMESDTETV
jgi:hypothetical protein